MSGLSQHIRSRERPHSKQWLKIQAALAARAGSIAFQCVLAKELGLPKPRFRIAAGRKERA